jgi:hypothetical protein
MTILFTVQYFHHQKKDDLQPPGEH